MRFIFAGLATLCLLTAFLTHSPALLGFSLLGIVVFSGIALLLFAQARIESTQQREIYIPSPEERAAVQAAAEKRRQTVAAARAAASGTTPATDDR
jgi:hypothetical protein